MVQWLRLHTSYARGAGSILGQGTKVPHAVQCSQEKKKCCSRLIAFQLLFLGALRRLSYSLEGFAKPSADGIGHVVCSLAYPTRL